MASIKKFITEPYGGYYSEPVPDENSYLTHVEMGSPGGELLRRYWQPVALSSELGELPLGVRMFGEDLVLFRTKRGEIGLIDRHCSHRGASLEFGILTDEGIQCCYHGWHFGVDGKILATPGDPPDSKLKDQLCHGAYPVHEYQGLIFGYFGPPDKKPEFPIYDTFEFEGDKLVPYSLHYPCNWIQVQENVMDPVHAVFLHTRMTFSHFADAWGEIPHLEFKQTPAGMIYVTTRRWGNNVWVRSNDILFPNLAQVGHIWEDGQEQLKEFARVGITRWTTPIDNENCKIIGWRHFHPEVDPRGIGDQTKCGNESVDFFGQSNDGRPFSERQELPGDYDAQVSQRPIARHALEHLTICDKGVSMFRRLLKQGIEAVENQIDPAPSSLRSGGLIPTYCHDTVIDVPPVGGDDDEELLAKISQKVTEVVSEGPHHEADNRTELVRGLIRKYRQSLVANAAE